MAVFTKLDDPSVYPDRDPARKGSQFFHAACEWQDAYEQSKKSVTYPHFYVTPPMLHLCIELFVKAHAKYIDAAFDSKLHGHKTTNIIYKYFSTVQKFSLIAKDLKLMQIIKEFEGSFVETRYGLTFVSFTGDEVLKLENTMERLRQAYTLLTGLRW